MTAPAAKPAPTPGEMAALREKCARLEAWAGGATDFLDELWKAFPTESATYYGANVLLNEHKALSDAPAPQGEVRIDGRRVGVWGRYDYASERATVGGTDIPITKHPIRFFEHGVEDAMAQHAVACGPTHYAGCACHEARHAQQIRDANAQCEKLQSIVSNARRALELGNEPRAISILYGR